VEDDGRYIGNCGLNDVDIRHGHAEVGIVIGEKGDQNKGFGRDAIRTLVRFGFDTLRLHRIEIRAADGNERAVHLYRAIGFTDVGLLREHTFVDGAYENEVVLDVLESEWRALA
jgi:RimJ/RimL family protein N-acetyltransferase